MNKPLTRLTMLIAAVAVVWLQASPADARTTLKTVCRVKGQEENTLQGLGIVIGLKGSGDGGSSLPMLRCLAQAMQCLGNPIQAGKMGPIELKDTKNVALVIVTATVPAAGARQGDKIDCMISSIGAAKSLVGGRLFTTPLMGQDPKNPRVYAIAEGLITLDNANMTTTGRVHNGCRLEEEFFNPFMKDGKITLVLDPSYADFFVASEIADTINSSQIGFQSANVQLARALNANNIEVSIPQQYATDPVVFVSQLTNLPMAEPQVGPRVVVNERAGSIIISGDTEIGPVVVTHKNIVVDTSGGNTPTAHFVPVDPKNDAPTLKALVESLNAVHVPTEDIIEIIKGLERNGKLRARLIIE
jgi:flagellar P-ring protein precursor FlgI